MKPVPGVIVVVPESSITSPTMRSPFAVVVQAVVVTLSVAVVPLAIFVALQSSGLEVAMPLYSWTMMRRNVADAVNVAVTTLEAGPLATMFAAQHIPRDWLLTESKTEFMVQA